MKIAPTFEERRSDFFSILEEQHLVVIDGKRCRRRASELIDLHLVNKAIAGNMRAIERVKEREKQLLLGWRKEKMALLKLVKETERSLHATLKRVAKRFSKRLRKRVGSSTSLIT